MRNKIAGRQLSRNRKSRIALFRSLTKELLVKGEIKTTLAKAKSIQADVDRLMNILGKDTLSGTRLFIAKLGNDQETFAKAKKQWLTLAKSKNSGFTRITRLAPRRGDRAELAKISILSGNDKKDESSDEARGELQTATV